METAGIGNLRCNNVMIGYKWDWRESGHQRLCDYVGILSDAFDSHFGVMVLRLTTRNDDLDDLRVGAV
jgi:hypothetical protein